jgi:5-(carboxyamino)imidazole ribonucleotide mutase
MMSTKSKLKAKTKTKPKAKPKKRFLVGIIMGSDSDLSVMTEAARFLDTIGISYEIRIVSAHRTTNKMVRYGRQAKTRGIKVIIAGAGGAAHLPGMIASITPLPVIGVPIKTSSLDGLDSLMSIVQMPAGVPVATVAINGAKNAAILASEILALEDQKIATKIENFKENLERDVIERARTVEKDSYTKIRSELGSTASASSTTTTTMRQPLTSTRITTIKSREHSKNRIGRSARIRGSSSSNSSNGSSSRSRV